MKRAIIEALEPRTLLSVAPTLSAADVRQIILQAEAVSLNSQAIVVVDRDGDILGVLGQPAGVMYRNYVIGQAVARARTAASFESTQDAFTTRTARFIIQDHFPLPVSDTPGGPLYGVEFSSLPGTDVLPPGLASGISGNPGGIPLYIDGTPVGAIGVAGTNDEIAARFDLTPQAMEVGSGSPQAAADPNNLSYTGTEEYDFNEAVAEAGAIGFAAPPAITANNILINGLRLPYTAEAPATGAPPSNLALPTLDPQGQPISSTRGYQSVPGLGKPTAQRIGTPDSPYPTAIVEGITGTMQNPNPNPAVVNFGIVNGAATPSGNFLDTNDVQTIMNQAVVEASSIRAAIREPVGVPASVFVSVVDTEGNILGVFRMGDATNFSFDVSVQKARTAAYFSDDNDAFSARAIGFLSQLYFPPGIDGNPTGPLFDLQNALATTVGTPLPGNAQNPLADGITTFPGGFPLYKNGHLVGAVGISGDGSDQDDLIAYTATTGYAPPTAIEDDSLSEQQIVTHLVAAVNKLPTLGFVFPTTGPYANIIDTIDSRLDEGLFGVSLPYAKFPRNPSL